MGGLPPIEGWSRRAALPTVLPVPGGEDGDRRAFRRRLGVTLGRVRRRLTNLTQQDVADHLGVDVETVGRYERGEREPKAFELHRLAIKYDVPGEWFMFPTDSVTELDARIAARRDELAVEAAALARERLAEEVEASQDAASRRASRRSRRPA